MKTTEFMALQVRPYFHNKAADFLPMYAKPTMLP